MADEYTEANGIGFVCRLTDETLATISVLASTTRMTIAEDDTLTPYATRSNAVLTPTGQIDYAR